MSEYGVQPTGYVRKPLHVILSELEDGMIEVFGPGVIQTSQSPLGQLNGMVADLVADIDEQNLDVYQSYDPDQAEGTRLDSIGKLRSLSRGDEQSDSSFRKSVTNVGVARYEIQDLTAALQGLSGVTYARVIVNESGSDTEYGQPTGSVAVIVTGGNESEIAAVMHRYIIPGIHTFGDERATVEINGMCRSMNIIRPTYPEIAVVVNARVLSGRSDCPPPPTTSVRNVIEDGWLNFRVNGLDVSHHSIRSFVESVYPEVEVVSVTGARNGGSPETLVEIEFSEIANLSVTVNFV